jgi:hypothetical protein
LSILIYKIQSHFILELNNANNKTTFKINLDDEYFSKNIKYCIAGEYKLTDAAKPYN